jgi:hypothetical protein
MADVVSGRDWVSGNAVFLPAPPITSRPVQNYNFDLPASIRYAAGSGDWAPFNLALYDTGAWEPFQQYDWPLPTPVAYPQSLREWTAANQSLYGNPLPNNQYDWPLPRPLVYPRNLMDWQSGAPGLYVNPVPVGNQYDWPLPRIVRPPHGVSSHLLGSAVYLPPPPRPSTNGFLTILGAGS